MSADFGFATRAIHEGQNPSKWNHRAIIPPISMTANFQHYAPGKYMGFRYSRHENPTRQCLEESLASLEQAKYALCFSCGMAAVMTVTKLLKAGEHIICCEDVFGVTNQYLSSCATKMGIELTFANLRDADILKKLMRENTRMVWTESPTNPTMNLMDLKAIADVLKAYHNVIMVVDNTFMSSYFQNPLQLGADIVLQSLTKYMSGHSDVLMGSIATNNTEIYETMKCLQGPDDIHRRLFSATFDHHTHVDATNATTVLGCVPSAFDCFLANRGLKTLHIRMERHMQNAMAVAKRLENHPAVEKVLYPGLESHPQHDLAKRQATGYGGMMAFRIKGGLHTARKFACSLKIFVLAQSLGSVESMVDVPTLMTHACLSHEQKKKLGITDNLIRLSVGLECARDLIQDLEQALEKAVGK